MMYKRFRLRIEEALKLKKAKEVEEKAARDAEEAAKQEAIVRAKTQASVAARANRIKRLVKAKKHVEVNKENPDELSTDKGTGNRLARLKAAREAKAVKAAKAAEKKRLVEEAEKKTREANEAAAALMAAQATQNGEDEAKKKEEEEALQSDWKEYQHPDTGQKYYHNSVTQETVWDKPKELMTLEEKKKAALSEAKKLQQAAGGSDTDGSSSDEEEDYNPEEDWQKWGIVTDPGSLREYYVNSDTSTTTWTCPKCMMLPGWEGAVDDKSSVYYFHKDKGTTQWEPPYREECDPALQAGKPWNRIERDVFATEMADLLECDARAFIRDIFDITKAGLLLCRLVNLIVPGTVDERALNGVTSETYELNADEKADEGDDHDESKVSTITRRKSLLLRSIDGKSEKPYKVSRRRSMADFSPDVGDQASTKSILLVHDVPMHQAIENHKLMLNSLLSIGVTVPSYVSPKHLAEADPHEILEVCYQLLKKHLQSKISLSRTKELAVLCADHTNADQVGELRSSSERDILLRWISRLSGSHISTFPVDGVRSEILLKILDATGGLSKKEGLDTVEAKVIATICERRLGAASWLRPEHLMKETSSEATKEGKNSGTTSDLSRIMELLCSEMFTFNHGLVMQEVEKAEFIETHDEGMSREDRTYKTWITSLIQNIEGAKPIRDLTEDLRNGELLLKLLALITSDIGSTNERGKTGVVEWRYVSLNSRDRFQQGDNLNYLLGLCQKLGMNLTNIGSADLLDRNVKILHALLYRLLRFHSLSIVIRATGHGARSVQDVDEGLVVAWVNQKLANSANGSSQMRSFRDHENRNSILFMELLEAMKVSTLLTQLALYAA